MLLQALLVLSSLNSFALQEAWKLSPKEVENLEKELTASPKARESRTRLVQYYYFERDRENCSRHLIVMAEHTPDAEELYFYSRGMIDEDQYSEIAKMLKKHASEQPNHA